MNKKFFVPLIIILIIVFIGYIIIDLTGKKRPVAVTSNEKVADSSSVEDQWMVSRVFEPPQGNLSAVAVEDNGNIVLGGESYVSVYSSDFVPLWTMDTEKPITAVSSSGDTVFASTIETILEISPEGERISEWGPFEDNAILTSVSANKTLVAFADAGNKIVTILDKQGNLKKIIGISGEPFIVPSAHFDVTISADNMLYVANPGKSRLETRDLDGKVISYIGEPGVGPGEFSGCCNPSNFAVIQGGFITAEKGINRIEILDEHGKFVESVSSANDFKPPIPLDVAVYESKIIYGANPADAKLYVFVHK
jgi:hypothetical protein